MLAKESLTQSLAFRTDVVASELEDGAVVFDLESKYFYQLNSTGWAIAQMFENGATLEAVHAQCRVWGASDEDESAIDEVVETLLNEGLISDSDDGWDIDYSDDESARDEAFSALWIRPSIQKLSEPLQRIIVSAFDPSVPLTE